MMLGVEREFEVFADFHQFLVRDPSADWGDLRWPPEAVDEMFVQGDGAGTESGKALAVPSGTYRVRVLYGGLNSVSDDGSLGRRQLRH
jgi:hypothetical protein